MSNNRWWTAVVIAGWTIIAIVSSMQPNPDDWFKVGPVKAVVVKDRVFVEYSRQIIQPFRGFWLVEVNLVTPNGLRTSCTGSSPQNYKPGDFKPIRISLEEFIGKECSFLPGETYQLDVTWTLRPVGTWVMEIGRISNEFVPHPIDQ